MSRGDRGVFRCLHKLRTMPRSPRLPAQTRQYQQSLSTTAVLVPTFGMATSDWTTRSDATNWLTIALPLLKLTAWALTALLLAGVTGFLQET